MLVVITGNTWKNKMETEENNLDKVLDYTANAIQLREDAKQYGKDTLEKYTFESVALIYDEMVRKIAK